MWERDGGITEEGKYLKRKGGMSYRTVELFICP